MFITTFVALLFKSRTEDDGGGTTVKLLNSVVELLSLLK
jgi:hypothetical protein